MKSIVGSLAVLSAGLLFIGCGAPAVDGDASPAPDARSGDAGVQTSPDVAAAEDAANDNVPALDTVDAPTVATDAAPNDVPAPDAGFAHLAGIGCGTAPPAGAAMPPALPRYSGGTCPRLAPGTNTLMSGGVERRFILVVPSDYAPATERLPLVFVYHYLGGSAGSILTNGQVQESTNALRFISVLPEKRGDLGVRIGGFNLDPAWPYLTTEPAARVEAEARFFDDMTACVAEQFPINESCVSAAGISAGALWVAQLLQLRAERLASAVLLSGGIGPATSLGLFDARGWRGAARAMPVMLGWGGASDQCGLNFQTASRNLERRLGAGGHFVEECIHNCGHNVPPVDPMVGLRVLWRFAIDHPYWLRAGQSPYLADGMPSGTPNWCGLGIGSARARTESCTATGFGGMACPVPAL